MCVIEQTKVAFVKDRFTILVFSTEIKIRPFQLSISLADHKLTEILSVLYAFSMEAADHAYLPPLERVASSSASSDVDQQIEIPLICLPECVVFPNETLPLRLRDRYLIQYFSSAMTRSDFTGLLGVWNYLTVYNHTEHVGIIAAIRAINCRDEEVVMQLKGKQRFHIIYLQRRSGVLFARVQLLADSVPYIAPEVHRTYHCDFRSKINSFPRWVYEAACARALCARIMSVIQSRRLITCGSSSLYLQLKNEAESHVEMFGYTLAANLPLTVQQRLFLLDCPDVSSRLREIYAICVDAGSLYMCAGCGQAIALRADLFTVPGAEGQVGAYVNPHGVVHQTVTFSSLLHLARVNLDGEPTVADSWFPGYVIVL